MIKINSGKDKKDKVLLMRPAAEEIIEEFKEYYSGVELPGKLKEVIKYIGGDDINLKFSSEFLSKTSCFSLCLSLDINNEYFSGGFNSKKVLYHLNVNKKDLSLTFSKTWFPDIEKRTIKIKEFGDIEPFLLEGAIVTATKIEAGEKDKFDCCSRYKECSDCKGCVQPVFDIAAGCRYWQKIRAGVIFY